MTVKCPECGHELEIMYEEILEYERGEFDSYDYWHKEFLGHCRNCLCDWQWEEWSEFGDHATTKPERKFWG